MTKLLSRFVSETEGQDLIEYALLAAIIALGVITAMAGVRSALNTQFSNISNTIATGS
jgi:pilus assembly protein Flp/PilA